MATQGGTDQALAGQGRLRAHPGHERPGPVARPRTGIIHQEWTGVSVKRHKSLKGLKTQNLRDHMSEAELIFTALAELSTRQIAETVQATGMPENAEAGSSQDRGTDAPGHRPMDMCVRMYDDLRRGPQDNPTSYSLLNGSLPGSGTVIGAPSRPA